MDKDEILQALRGRKINWFDFALALDGEDAGDSKTWRMLIEVEEFRDNFPEVGSNHLSAFYGWIVGRNPECTRATCSSALVETRWIGPMDHPTLTRKIAAGEISYSDVLWRPGMSRWERIGSSADFSKGVASNVLCGVERMLAQSEDHVANDEEVQTVITPSEPDVQVQLISKEHDLPEEAVGVDLVGELPWMRTLLTFVLLVLGFAGASSQAGTFKVIEIVPLKMNSSKPSLVIQTDAPVGQPIEVVLTGQSGEVLGHLSWQKTFHVVRQEGEIPTIDLAASEALPRGTFTVEAAAGDVKISKRIFIGNDDSEFQAALKSYLKLTAAQRQTEKLTLFHEAQNLRFLAHQLLNRLKKGKGSEPEASSWQNFYANWKTQLQEAEKALLALEPDEQGEFAYPEQIADCRHRSVQLEETALQLKESIDSEQPVGAPNQVRDLASESVKSASLRSAISAIEQEFKRMQTKASRM